MIIDRGIGSWWTKSQSVQGSLGSLSLVTLLYSVSWLQAYLPDKLYVQCSYVRHPSLDFPSYHLYYIFCRLSRNLRCCFAPFSCKKNQWRLGERAVIVGARPNISLPYLTGFFGLYTSWWSFRCTQRSWCVYFCPNRRRGWSLGSYRSYPAKGESRNPYPGSLNLSLMCLTKGFAERLA